MATPQATTRRYAARVTTCDPTQGLIQVIMKPAEKRNISVYTLPAAFRWPEVGETIMVIQLNGTWYIEGYAPSTTAFQTAVNPGDMVLTAPTGRVYVNTDKLDTDGAPIGYDLPSQYEADFGDGTSSSFPIEHDLGVQFVDVTIINNNTLQEESATVTDTSTTVCTISAEYWIAHPPTLNEYHVIILG